MAGPRSPWPKYAWHKWPVVRDLFSSLLTCAAMADFDAGHCAAAYLQTKACTEVPMGDESHGRSCIGPGGPSAFLRVPAAVALHGTAAAERETSFGAVGTCAADVSCNATEDSGRASQLAADCDEKRFVALSKWVAILELNPPASQVGRSVLLVQTVPYAEEKVCTLRYDAFAMKATSTLDLRASVALRFLKWHSRFRPSDELDLPVKEVDTYNYFGHLKDTREAPTAAAGALQAWSFCVHVLGFNDVYETAGSLRCMGSAHRQFLHKRRLRRKVAFLAAMIAVLEVAAEFERDVTLRALVGYAVFCTHGRLRNADGNCLVHWDVDLLRDDRGLVTGGFVEASALGLKTGKSKEKQTTFLPVVVPLGGLVSNTWFEAFLRTRAELGLPSLQGKLAHAS